MPGMNAVELIKSTREFLKRKGLTEEDMPTFAFRGKQFWELPPEKVAEVFKLGVKSRDIVEQVAKKSDIESYFKKIGYFYRQLADD
jgi:hypothetical protein